MSQITVENIKRSSETVARSTRGVAAAWVNFDGTGTIAARDSENVSSLTDNGTGQYAVNFTNAFDAADYNVSLSGQDTGSGSQDTEAMAIAAAGLTTGSTPVTNIGFGGTFTDLPAVFVLTHGDLA